MTITRSPEPPILIENLQDFYTATLEYYDELFPIKDDALKLFLDLQKDLQESAITHNAPLCRYLGIGCATGTMENRLSNYGFDITGIDKNPAMIETAKRRMKRGYSTLRFFEMSAIDMKRFLKQGSFNIISCIENTLSYISDETLLRKFFHDARQLLAPGGTFVLQTLNLDFFLRTAHNSLPDLSSIRVTLHRSFIRRDDGLMTLDASLELGSGRKMILEKTTHIMPLTAEKIEAYAKEAGFTSISRYSDFALSPWTEESPNIVMLLS